METNDPITRLLEMLEHPEDYSEQEIHSLIHHDEATRHAYEWMVTARQSYRQKEAERPVDIDAAWQKFQRSLTPDPIPGRSLTPAPSPKERGVYTIRHGEQPTKGNHAPLLGRKATGRRASLGNGVGGEAVGGKAVGGEAVYRKIAAIFLAAVFLGGLAWAISPLLTSSKEDEKSQLTQVTAHSLTGRAGGGSSILFTDVRLDSMLTAVARHYAKAVAFGNDELKELRIYTRWNPEDSLAVFIENLNELDGLQLTEQHDTIFVQGKTHPSPSL